MNFEKQRNILMLLEKKKYPTALDNIITKKKKKITPLRIVF